MLCLYAAPYFSIILWKIKKRFRKCLTNCWWTLKQIKIENKWGSAHKRVCTGPISRSFAHFLDLFSVRFVTLCVICIHNLSFIFSFLCFSVFVLRESNSALSSSLLYIVFYSTIHNFNVHTHLRITIHSHKGI